jgi:8-oxo-dGTP pyrophosphatase MutT (NUDIX family)
MTSVASSTDHLATRFPVSIKGVVFIDNKVLLLKNERDEWELPGGKLESGEVPEMCCERELLEETGLLVKAEKLLDVWIYKVVSDVEVLIITFGCSLIQPGSIRISQEHTEVGLFPIEQLPEINAPKGYIQSIKSWHGHNY